MNTYSRREALKTMDTRRSLPELTGMRRRCWLPRWLLLHQPSCCDWHV